MTFLVRENVIFFASLQQGHMRQVRRGILAADVDAGQPENPGVAVRATLPAERRGRLQGLQPF